MRFQIDINGEANPLPSQPVRPRPLSIFAFVLHDFQTTAFFRKDLGYSVPRGLYEDHDKLKNEKGWPEMVPFEPREGVDLTAELQWFWFKQLVLSYFGHAELGKLLPEEMKFMKEAWRGITKGHTAFCNNKGTDTHRDFIRNVNKRAGLPMLWENTCGGSIIELSSTFKYSKGYKVKTLKTSAYKQWKDWTYLDHPQFFSFATNATPYLSGTKNTYSMEGPWKVNPMHYLEGKDIPVPIISDAGHVFVEPNRVRILDPFESPPGPYVE
jgi:hypothetical protein